MQVFVCYCLPPPRIFPLLKFVRSDDTSSFFFFFFAHHLIYLLSSPIFFSLSFPLPRNSDLGSHSRLFSPLPATVRAFHFLSGEDFSLFLPSSTRIELCLYPRCKALSTIEPFFIFANKVKVRPTSGSNPGLKQVEFKVNHLNHRGDRLYMINCTCCNILTRHIYQRASWTGVL